MTFSRRDFIMRAAAVGGYSAAVAMMQALGVTSASAAEALPRDPTVGRGRAVIVLGAGPAGLISAYELDKAGFAVTVLEARNRVGGRNWTVRGGDLVRHMHGPDQEVAFDPEHYFNCGPARLPSSHENILGYCRELGVALEVEINASRSAYAVSRDGKRVRMRQLVNDTRGWVSELLAKAAKSGALDGEVSAADRASLLDFLRAYGDLDAEHAFNGTMRSGYSVEPGTGATEGVAIEKLSLSELTSRDKFFPSLFEEIIDMQPTMFQPVGGMDQIPKAFARALDGKIRLGAEVRGFSNRADGVEVIWREGGVTRSAEAAFLVSALPAPLTARLRTNLSRGRMAAIGAAQSFEATKLAWQAPRFWEREEQIYGGLGYLDHPATFLWYPSYGLFSDEGVVLGCYNFDNAAQRFRAMSMAQRCEASRAAIELAHPGRGHLLRHPVSIVWRDMAYNEAAWVIAEPAARELLSTPEGRVHLAGDWLTPLVGWQEGAAHSAHRAVRTICERAREENAAAPL